MQNTTNRPTATDLDAELEALQQSVLAAIAAHDGLLGGGPVESDAEIQEKYNDSLSRRDLIQFGWIDPDESAVTTATRTGRIGGSQENVGCITEPESEYVTQPTYFVRPKVPNNLRCMALGSTNGFTTLPDGAGKVLHLPDGSCEHCREWRRRKVALRYGLGKGTQTLIRVVGFASDDYTLPVAVAESMRRRVGGKRLRLLRRGENYLPELVQVYDCEIDDRTRMLIHVDLLRKGLRGSIWVGPVTSAMVYALADSEPTRLGTRRIRQGKATWRIVRLLAHQRGQATPSGNAPVAAQGWRINYYLYKLTEETEWFYQRTSRPTDGQHAANAGFTLTTATLSRVDGQLATAICRRRLQCSTRALWNTIGLRSASRMLLAAGLSQRPSITTRPALTLTAN